MSKHQPISRNTFLRMASGLVLGLIAWIWYQLSGFQAERESRMEFRHGNDIPLGISYFEKYYLFRNDQGVRAFLTRCTHAGCRIVTGSGNVLNCNCHGSKFEAETGKPLKGPAIKPLTELECRFDEKNGQWVIKFRKTT